MADIFPGLHSIQHFLAKTAVVPNTHGRTWLLSLESDVKTVEDLLVTLPATHIVSGKEVETQYSVYSAERYAETIVFVVLKLDCTFARLKTLFDKESGLLGKVVRQPTLQKLKDFLLGAKGTKIEEWGTVFPIVNAKFDQDLLNQFAEELKIDSISTLVVLYHRLSRLFNTEFCRRMKVSITEQHAERLYKEHSSNSRAFRSNSRQLSFAKTAVEIKKCNIDFVDYMTKTNLDVLQELCDQFDLSQLGDLEKHQQDFIQFLEDRVSLEQLRPDEDEMRFWDYYIDMINGEYRKQTLLITGAYQSGKTVLAAVLLSPFDAPTIDPNKNTDSFWLETAVNRRAVLFDDVLPEGLQVLEDMATHIDGGVAVSMNRKHRGRECQRFPPSIITTSVTCSEAAYPKLHTRVVEMKMTTPISGKEMIECSKRIMGYPKEKKINALICALHMYYVGRDGSLLTRKIKAKRCRKSFISDSPRKEVKIENPCPPWKLQLKFSSSDSH